jgi:hypothetical protein
MIDEVVENGDHLIEKDWQSLFLVVAGDYDTQLSHRSTLATGGRSLAKGLEMEAAFHSALTHNRTTR